MSVNPSKEALQFEAWQKTVAVLAELLRRGWVKVQFWFGTRPLYSIRCVAWYVMTQPSLVFVVSWDGGVWEGSWLAGVILGYKWGVRGLFNYVLITFYTNLKFLVKYCLDNDLILFICENSLKLLLDQTENRLYIRHSFCSSPKRHRLK